MDYNDNDYVGVDERYRPRNVEPLSDGYNHQSGDHNQQFNGNNHPKRRNKRLIISIIVILLPFLFVGAFMAIGFSLLGNFANSASEMQNDMMENMLEKQSGLTENMLEKQQGIKDNINDMTDTARSDRDKRWHNAKFMHSAGKKSDLFVASTIDAVIDNNKQAVTDSKNGRTVSVIFDGKEITDPEELKNIKTRIQNYTEYEVSVEYDEEGYIYQIIIENSDKMDIDKSS